MGLERCSFGKDMLWEGCEYLVKDVVFRIMIIVVYWGVFGLGFLF